MRIAVDAMGGDFAPKNIVAGAVSALAAFPRIERLYLVGDTQRIQAELAENNCTDQRVEIIHTTQIVEMHDSPGDAVRKKKDSSISRAIDLVKESKAEAVVSAGHTGAAVFAATLKLRTLPGVERAGIASVIPTETNLFVLIDAGANPEPRPIHLLQYGIMGAVYSKYALKCPNPSVGLMSIGTEDLKGNDLTTGAFALLKETELNFRGNVEGHDLFENPVDVVVCDGFTGNVMLKTMESIAHAIFHWIKNEIRKNPIHMLGGKLARGALRRIWKKTNYEEYGGSPLLGVNGVCIIAHGSSSPLAIHNAIRVAAESIELRINPLIVEEVKKYQK